MFDMFKNKKPVEGAQTVHFREYLFKDLANGINQAADFVRRIGESVGRTCPVATWSVETFFALLQDNEVINYMIDQELRRRAAAMGLDCGYGDAPQGLGADQKDNRKIVRATARENTAGLDELIDAKKYRAVFLKNVTTYLRTGAIRIASKGEVIIDENYGGILKSYCSLKLETAAEREFYQAANALATAAKNAKAAHDKLKALAMNGQDVGEISGVDFQYSRLRVCDGINVNADGMAWRSVLYFVTKYRENDGPKFYNRKGEPMLDARRVYELVGYLPAATPYLRIKFPDLYKGVPFRGNYASTIDGYDDPRQLEETKGSNVRIDNFGRPVIGGASLDDRPALAVSVHLDK